MVNPRRGLACAAGLCLCLACWAASVEVPYNLKTAPLPEAQAQLLIQNRFLIQPDGTIIDPSDSQPVTHEDMPYMLQRLESGARLKALLQIDLILSKSQGEKNLTYEERDAIRRVVKENWRLLTLKSRKDFRGYFSLQELEPMDQVPLPRPRLMEPELKDQEALPGAPLPAAVIAAAPAIPAPAAVVAPPAPVVAAPAPVIAAPAALIPAPAAVVAPPAPVVAAPAPVIAAPAALIPAPAAVVAPPAPVVAAPAPVIAAPAALIPAPAAVVAPPAPVVAAPAAVVVAPAAAAPSAVPAAVTAAIAAPAAAFAALAPVSQAPAAPAPPAPAPVAPAPAVAVTTAAVTAALVPVPVPELAAPAPPVSLEPPLRDIPAADFEKFLADAPYGREAKAMLLLISQKAPVYARVRVLSDVTALFPQVILDPAAAGDRTYSGLVVGPDKAATVALNSGAALFEKRKLFFGGVSVLLPLSAKTYAEAGLPAPALQALQSEAIPQKRERGPWGQTAVYADGSSRAVFSTEQLAGALLAELMRFDARLRGWDASSYAVEVAARTAQMLFYDNLALARPAQEFLDVEMSRAYRQWLEFPGLYRGSLLSTLTASRLGAVDPRRAGLSAAAEFGRRSLEDCPRSAAAEASARAAAAKQARAGRTAAYEATGLFEADRLAASRAGGGQAAEPSADPAACAARWRAELDGLPKSAAVLNEAVETERRLRQERHSHAGKD